MPSTESTKHKNLRVICPPLSSKLISGAATNLPATNKLGDADTSELIAGAYSVVHVWKPEHE